MSVKRYVLLWLVIILFLPLRAEEHHSVFILHSYSHEYPWTKAQHNRFVSKFTQDTPLAYSVSVEYLDTKRVEFSDDYQAKFLEFLLKKYAGLKPDIIYVTDDDALNFMQRYENELFAGAPVVFSGVNDITQSDRLNRDRYTGVFEHKALLPNIRLTQALTPGTQDVILVGDDSSTYKATAQQWQKELSLETIEPELIASRNIQDVEEALLNRSPSYVILTTIGGFSDGEKTLTLYEAIKRIAGAGSHRLLTMEDVYMYPGVLGGYVTSGAKQGEIAAEKAQMIIHGLAPAKVGFTMQSPNRYLFDRRELDNADISLPPAIAAQAELRNIPPNLYDSYRTFILGALLFMATALFIGMVLFVIFMRKKNRMILIQRNRLKRRTQELERTRESLTTAQKIAHFGNWDWDIAKNTLCWSDGIFHIFQMRPDKFKASYEAFMERVHPEDREAVQAAVQAAIENRKAYDIHHRIVLPDKQVRIVHEQGEVHFDKSGNPLRMIGSVHDVTAQKHAEERLEQLANYDPLTGLPNRNFLNTYLEKAINRTNRSDAHLAILFMDLDNFKVINDTMGHDVGDELLINVASRLSANIRSSDTIIRMGGDEFIIILEQVKEPIEAAAFCENILHLFANPFVLRGNELFASTSIGISLYPDDGNDVQSIIKHADTAMYHSKEEGKNKFRFFTPSMNAQAMTRLMIENSLRKAIDNAEFELVYQPQYTIADKRLVGGEALLRWRHAEFGYIPPSDFIPIAEKGGLIVAIGDWVITTALTQIRQWQSEGKKQIRIAVNISSRQLADGQLHDKLSQLLAEFGVSADTLAIELTESTLMDASEAVLNQLLAIRKMGIEIAIDDFGTGYSSLSYLKKLPIDKLKIDRSFIQDLEEDPDDRVLTTTIITMAKSLNLITIAEGVETEQQRDFLLQNGCDKLQGYLYGKPVSAEVFTELL